MFYFNIDCLSLASVACIIAFQLFCFFVVLLMLLCVYPLCADIVPGLLSYGIKLSSLLDGC
jgi:hypothetical protein